MRDNQVSKKILLIDDDEDDHFFFSSALQEIAADYTCEWATDGEKGLAVLKYTDPLPHYIFLDINMPRMTGFEVLAEIKRLPSVRDIPVVVYSTSRAQNHIQESMQLGAYKYITKPSSVAELKEDLQFLTDRPGAPKAI